MSQKALETGEHPREEVGLRPRREGRVNHPAQPTTCCSCCGAPHRASRRRCCDECVATAADTPAPYGGPTRT